MLRLQTPLTLDTLESHMVRIEKGEFMMGGESFGDPKPIHKVTLTRNFALCRYPVTQALWEAVMGNNPSRFRGSQRPAEMVNWYEAVDFCNRLSKKQELNPAYEIDSNSKDPNNHSDLDDQRWIIKPISGSNGYRLPTEAEWEYAARGGPYARGVEYAGSPELDQAGWYNANSNRETQPVGQKRPNELGLYDMSGNVFEWSRDWFNAYPFEPQVNPNGSKGGFGRITRGGSWDSGEFYFRVTYRPYTHPDSRNYQLGFRLARYL